MTTRKNTKKALLSSILALFLCFVMLLGTTFAWFTDEVTSAGNVIKSGTLDVELEYKTSWGDEWSTVNENTKLFNENALYEPGYTEIVFLRISNAGSLALKYQLQVNVTNEVGATNVLGESFKLSDYLQIGSYVQDEYSSGFNYADILMPTMFGSRESALSSVGTMTKLSEFAPIVRTDSPILPGDETAQVIAIVLTMPESVENEANAVAGTAPSLDLGVRVLATQYTDESDGFGNDYDSQTSFPSATDTWDGTIDLSWYDPDATEYTLNSAEALAGLAALIDGNVPATYLVEEFDLPVTFEGKTVTLNTDVDLYLENENGEAVCFDPIGSYRNDRSFMGTFDGQGHVIKNMSQNTWALDNGYYYTDCGLGLFGQLEDATVKNLVLDGASVSGESALCGTVAAVAHNTAFENITVSNSNVADYQYYAGGIVGWASGEIAITDCNVDASTNVAAQWGDFDNSIGGLIGGASTSAQILIKDTTVACRIDAYNDVTSSYQWYAYRRAGMLIGNSGATETVDGTTVAVAPQLTCENVEVIYGDWANYTYCEFAGTSWPYVRVQEGVSNSAYSNPRYGHPTDANGNEVVDDNHVHNEGEDHLILCAFDQLYGGGQGVYGQTTHKGVTVIYNNK